MSNKDRRLKRVNRLQIIGILALVVAGFFAYTFLKSPGNQVKLHFILPDGSKTSTFTADLAINAADRTKGLMFVTSMPKKHGMLFIFPKEEIQSFWMKNTYLSLDMIFMDINRQVVGIIEKVPPLNTRKREIAKPSTYVLELNAGEASQYGIVAGSKLIVKPEVLVPKE